MFVLYILSFHNVKYVSTHSTSLPLITEKTISTKSPPSCFFVWVLTLDSSDPVLPAGEGVGDIGEGVLFRRLLQLF